MTKGTLALHRMPLLASLLAFVLIAAPVPAPARQSERLTVERILTLLKAGSPPETLLGRVQKEGGDFDLTIEDVVRLRAAGATPELIRLMAQGAAGAPDAAAAGETPPPAPSPDALTVRRVVKMHQQKVPEEEIAAQIARRGLKEPPDLQELLELRAQGVPDTIVRALAQAGTLAPMAIADIVSLLERQTPPAAVAAEIRTRGMRAAPTIDDILELRKAGADDAVVAAVSQAAPATGVTEEAGETAGTGEIADTEGPQESAGTEEPVWPGMELSLPAPGEDRVLVSSVPPGVRVYIAPSRTRLTEAFRRDYLAGRTPLSLSLPPGDYRVILQKEPGEFENGLVPAWRTFHDMPGTRSLLDEADLTFDPDHCCLPGSLSGTVEVHAVAGDLPQGIIGDLFDGLPPYLFDGERMQILSVRKSRIAAAMKVYEMRKNPGQSRLLVGTFLHSEGDPLDQSAVSGLPAGTPFDVYLDAPAVDFLTRPEETPALASALGVEPEHLSDAVAMLRKAGKAILHQQVQGGLRLLSIALDDDGRLRVSDQTVIPVDPFAPPPPAPKKKKKKIVVPPPPPLPPVEREVVPGLDLPRLAIDNKSSKGLGLLLNNGLFCFVPARTMREFVVDPGTFEARVMGGAYAGGASAGGADAGGAGAAGAARGTLHFSYHARYTMTF